MTGYDRVRGKRHVTELAGRVAVVTGAASGLGYAMTARFLGAGMRVAMADVEEAALRGAARELSGAGEVLAVPTDVTRPESVAALRERVDEKLGPAHLLCNNAGVVSGGGATWDISLPAWQWAFEVNLMGVVYGIREFLPGMVRRGAGHVINTASIAGLLGTPFGAPYGTTKHAVVGLSKGLHLELRVLESDVRVSVLCPGYIRTNLAGATRNWPTRLGEPPEVDPTLAENTEASIAAGMDPAQVADEVLDAVLGGRFWVTPNADDFLPYVVEGARGVLTGEPPRAFDTATGGDPDQ